MKKSGKKITAERVIIISFLVDISDVLINVLVAYISGSVVMLSQALEGGADLLSTGFLLIGVKRGKTPKDKMHPYGYGRELYFWTFISALVTFTLTAGLSFYFGLERFLNPEKIESLGLAFLALFIALISNGYALSLSIRRLLGKRSITSIWQRFSHSALIETKTTLVLDVMGTAASGLGIIALLLYLFTGDLRFDGLGSMAIGLTLAYLAFIIIKGAKDLLVGKGASEKVNKKIVSIAKSFKGVEKVIDLRTLYIGSERLLVNLEINLEDKLTTDEIERLIDKIQKEVNKEIPEALDIYIELETPDV